jgi:hypothetical protein
LNEWNLCADDDTTRPSRFNSQFIQVLEKVMVSFRHLVSQYMLDPNLSKQLAKFFNLTTANFLTDLFAVMDRGIVFELVSVLSHFYQISLILFCSRACVFFFSFVLFLENNLFFY